MIEPTAGQPRVTAGEGAASTTSIRRRLIVTLGVLAGALAVASLLGFGLARDREGTPAGLGTPAPAFTLPGLNGGVVALDDYGGDVVLLYFWASWCIPCREDAPELEAMWRTFGQRGVTFIGINIQDTEADAKSFAREFNLSFPLARDAGGRVYLDYGVYGVPETFLLAADGTIHRRWIGPADKQQVRESLEALLQP